jgi:hypothetical protein
MFSLLIIKLIELVNPRNIEKQFLFEVLGFEFRVSHLWAMPSAQHSINTHGTISDKPLQ